MRWLHLICPNYCFSNLFAFPFGFWYFVHISCLDEHLRITLFWYMHWSPSAIQVTTYPFKIFLFKKLCFILTQPLLMTPSLFRWLKTPTHSELNEKSPSCATQSLHIFNKCLTYSLLLLSTSHRIRDRKWQRQAKYLKQYGSRVCAELLSYTQSRQHACVIILLTNKDLWVCSSCLYGGLGMDCLNSLILEQFLLAWSRVQRVGFGSAWIKIK